MNEVIKEGAVTSLKLSELADDGTTWNKAEYKLRTEDLEFASETITSDKTYNFGFSGNRAISITSNNDKTAIFAGDNSDYTGDITLPSKVKFAGSKSLFNFNKEYGEVTFSSGEFTNEVAAGKTVKIGTMTLEEGHAFNINGTLVL